MATSASIIAASQDTDLLQRVAALAAQAGVENPQAWAESNRWQIAAAPVTASGDTVASVYEYAQATYEPAPRPGENPAAVTDDHLTHAIQSLLTG